ncbi:dTDP-glucose 4,6-dehydratase [Streptomyces cacaoi]|uniref:dTDP-glucose 4,6-dehydratase n=1 Tax=Streptomyces cacaoi TaxID=1898 RepID=UPI0011F3EB93|nr:dTDP-glucose 4,6-dehydratase [Streptomyces cacaoi]
MTYRVLVTGGAGFIGSCYVRALLNGELGAAAPAADAAVTVLDKFTYAAHPANLPSGDGRCTVVEGDICDADPVRGLVAGTDLVVNFAAETHVDRSIRDGGDFVRSNTLGVETLARACLDARVPRLVQVSTDEVYGSIAHGAWDESAPVAPNSPYAAAKAGGDLVALSCARTHGLPVSVTRCSNTYGPRQFPEKLIPLFVTNLLRGRQVPLYGDGRNVREWIHVSDHCRAVHLVAERGAPGEVYHVAGDTRLTNRALTKLLLELLGAGPERIAHVADRKGHDLRYALDGDRLAALGHRPRVPFRAGLADTVEWYRDHPEWWRPLLPD